MKQHKGKIILKKRILKVIDCNNCGFLHLWPFPSSRLLKKFYKKEYFQKSNSTKLLDFEKEKREYNWSSLEYEDSLAVFNKYIKKPGRILDTGCGNGFFLKFMKNKGWQVLGLEPSEKAIYYTKKNKVTVINKTLEDFYKKEFDMQFDVICCRNVIEHIKDPKNFLLLCRKLLKKKQGVLYIVVPNDFNILQIALRNSLNLPYWWVAVPDHINYFNFQTICRLIEQSGFKIILKTTDFPMELFLLLGKNYIRNKKIGKECHKKRMKFDLSLSQDKRRFLYKTLADFNLGRAAIIFAKAN